MPRKFKKVVIVAVVALVGFGIFKGLPRETKAVEQQGVITMDFKDTDPGYDFPDDCPVGH